MSKVQKSPIQFWFVCKGKECMQGFQKLDDFLQHKIDSHVTEFLTTTCILFEERHLCHVPFPVRNLESAQLTVNETIPLPPAPPSYFAEPDRAVNYYDSGTVNGNKSSVTTELSPSNTSIIGNNEETVEPSVTTIVQGNRVEHNNYEIEPKIELIVYEKAGQSIANNSPAVSSSSSSNELPAPGSCSSTTQNPRKCRLCKMQPLNSEQELRKHLDLCSLSHRSRRRFCLPCNRLYPSLLELQKHQLRIHGAAISDNKRGHSRPRKDPLVCKNPIKLLQIKVKPAPAKRRPARRQKRPKPSTKSLLTDQTMGNQLVNTKGRGRTRKGTVNSAPQTPTIKTEPDIQDTEDFKPGDVAEDFLSPRITSTYTVFDDNLTSASGNNSENESHQLLWKSSVLSPSKNPPKIPAKSSSNIFYADLLNDHLYSCFDLNNLKASNLTNESKVSTHEFICVICNALFNYKHHCFVHVLSHTGEKPFSCKVCKKSYTQHHNLRVHLKRAHT